MSETGRTNGKMTLEKAKLGRFISRLVFAAVAFIVPTVIVAVKFQIFTQSTPHKITALGLVLLVCVAWRFRKKAMEWVNSWEYSSFKYVVIGFSKVWVFILIIALLALAKKGMESVLYCVEWFALCECIAYLVIYPIENYFDYYVKRMIRKNERKEDLKEALRELETEKEA